MGGSAPNIERFKTLLPGQEFTLESIVDLVTRSLESGIDAYGGSLTPQSNEILQGLYNQVRDRHGRAKLTPEQGIRNDRLREFMGGAPIFDMDPDERKAFYKATTSDPIRGKQSEVDAELRKRYGAGLPGDLSGGKAVSRAALDEKLGAKEEELVYRDVQRGRESEERAQGRRYSASRLDAQSRASDLTNLLILGGLERTEEGQARGEDYYKWQSEQDYFNPWLGFLPQILGTQTFTTGVNPGQPSQVGSAISAGLSGLTQLYTLGQGLYGQPGQPGQGFRGVGPGGPVPPTGV